MAPCLSRFASSGRCPPRGRGRAWGGPAAVRPPTRRRVAPQHHRGRGDRRPRALRLGHRRALAGRVRRGSAARRRQLAVAERRRAGCGRHRVQAGLALRGEEARRRAGRSQHRRPRRARGDGQAARLDAARLLLARRQAQRRARDGARPDRLSRPRARGRLPRVPPRRRRRARDPAGPLRLAGRLRADGIGKSRLLGELARQGAQVLDLEGLANHRGSVLGLVPGSEQPSQKHSTPASGRPCASSTRRGRCSWRARARRSAICACPRR